MATGLTSIDRSWEVPTPIRRDIPSWSENYALVGGDEKTGLALFCSIGRWHADPSIWRILLFVNLPNGRTAYARHYGRGDDRAGPCSGLWKLEVLEPGRRLALACEGPFWLSTADAMRIGVTQAPSVSGSVRVEFSSTQPIWDMSGGASESAAIAGKLHYEQIGVFNGSITMDGATHSLVNGYANRDHSCGPRDVTHYLHHAWISGFFENGESFQLYAMQSAGSAGYDMANAVFITGNELIAAKVLELSISKGDSLRRTPRKIVIEAAGRVMDIEVPRVVTQTPISFANPFDMAPGIMLDRNMAICLDGLIELRLDGVRGRGWCEIGTATGSLDIGN